jgi:serine/threonine protein kinase
MNFIWNKKKKNEMATKIGEGSYGCVHKPSLRCKNKEVDYTNKVSKTMTKTHATTEMQEYDKISEVDKKNRFYLGKPTICEPTDDDSAKQAINMCRYLNGKSIKDYNLLIMNDGGNNLKQYADKMSFLPKTPENIEKIEKFWIEAQRILLGLKVFSDNGIVHHDLKPQNIVYNEDTNRTNFIDFGLMTDMDTIRSQADKNQYRLGVSHWSFPLEMNLTNIGFYMIFLKEIFKKRFNCLNYLPKKDIKDFLSYIDPNYHENNKIFKKKGLKDLWDDISSDFCKFTKHIIENNSKKHATFALFAKEHNIFLDRVINTIDVYGTGIAFMYILNKTRHLIEPELEDVLRKLFYNMVNPNVFVRYFPDEVLNNFEKILLENGILTKYNKHFENHELVNDKPIIPINNVPNKPNNLLNTIISEIKEQKINRILDTIDNNTTSEIKEQKINRVLDTTSIKKCPLGKELNPFTRRCVNVCKYGYMRNDKFKCVRDKSKNIKLTKTRKVRTPVK